MGNFEKLSVLVIGVIIVMILVVAIHTWTTDPGSSDAERGDALEVADLDSPNLPLPPVLRSEDPLPPVTDVWEFEEELRTPDGPSELARVDSGAGAEETEAASATREASLEPVERRVTVKQGDTLGHISLRMYDTTRYWRKIAEANNVAPESLRVGMVLVIPDVPDARRGGDGRTDTAPAGGGPVVRGTAYTVRAGDTIQKISKAAFGTVERWPDIWFENMERIRDPDDLPIGTEIRLPN